MALDPSIILGVQPVQQQDPYKQYMAAAQLRDAAQLSQQRGLEIKAMTRQQETSAALDDALSKATVIDPATGKVDVNRAQAVQQLKQGGFGQAGVGLQEGWEKQDLARAKEGLENQKTMLANQQAHVEAVSGAANYILALPEEARPAAYAALVPQLEQRGIVAHGELPPQYEANVVTGAQAQGMKASDFLKSQNDKIERDQKSVSLAQEAQKNSTQALYQQQEIAARAQTDATTRRGQNMTNAREAQRLRIEAGHLQLAQAQQQLQTGGVVEAQAQQIANYDAPQVKLSRTNPLAAAINARALELNPTLSNEGYQAHQSLYSQKPGSVGTQVNKLGTAILHSQAALKASAEIGTAPLINSHGLIASMFRSNKDAGYHVDAEFAKGEVGQLVTSGKLTVDEGKQLSVDLDSPSRGIRDEALYKFIDRGMEKIGQTFQGVQAATRKPIDYDRVFNSSPEVIKALQNSGIIRGGKNTNAPQEGATKTNSHGDALVYTGGKWALAPSK